MSGLRILGGEARGRVLKTLKEDDLSIRPMLGRMKKSLFDILAPRMEGAAFLDLYAGTGAVGLEALSRGADHVVFVELSPKSLNLVRENAKMLGWERRTVIHRADVLKGLAFIREQFDIIFMGPPYKDEKKTMLCLTGPTLAAVQEANLLKDGGIIVSQHHDTEPVTVPQGLEAYRREKYGDTIVDFYKKAETL